MQESYLPLKPSHAPGTSCSYTAVTSFGTTWKDFGGNILACPSLKRTFACTFLAIYYNKQAALKLITTSLLFLDFCLFVCLENFESVSSKRCLGMKCFLQSHSILRACTLRASGSTAQWLYGKGKGSESVLLMNGNLAWESLKRLLPAHKIFLQEEETLFSASNKSHFEVWNYRQDWDLFSGEGCWGVQCPLLLACLISFTASITFFLIYSYFSCIQLSGLRWENFRMETVLRKHKMSKLYFVFCPKTGTWWPHS